MGFWNLRPCVLARRRIVDSNVEFIAFFIFTFCFGIEPGLGEPGSNGSIQAAFFATCPLTEIGSANFALIFFGTRGVG